MNTLNGNLIFQFFAFAPLLLPVLIFIIIIIVALRIVHRFERRAEERLNLDKENTTLLQKQIQEINQRLTNIENTLKEVD